MAQSHTEWLAGRSKVRITMWRLLRRSFPRLYWGKRFSHLDESYFSIVLCKCPFLCAWWIVRVTGNICPWWHVMLSCREAVQPSAGPRQGQKEIIHCSQGSVLQTCSVTLQKTCKESMAPSFINHLWIRRKTTFQSLVKDWLLNCGNMLGNRNAWKQRERLTTWKWTSRWICPGNVKFIPSRLRLNVYGHCRTPLNDDTMFYLFCPAFWTERTC